MPAPLPTPFFPPPCAIPTMALKSLSLAQPSCSVASGPSSPPTSPATVPLWQRRAATSRASRTKRLPCLDLAVRASAIVVNNEDLTEERFTDADLDAMFSRATSVQQSP
eukprot:m.61303 g.61303  ORF g.61303 m.61303 type:complete len:109 (-) comp13197_c2_seq1:113-439(-)